MQMVFSERLLGKLRTHREYERCRISPNDGRLLDSNKTAREEQPLGSEDPDDSIDPDDSGPRLVVTLKEPVGEIYALPACQAEQTSGRCPDNGDQSKAPQSSLGASTATAGTPAPPDLLDPVVLRTMPPRVAAFMLYEPREPPPWQRHETLEERAHKVQLEDCGSWVGE